MSDNKTQPTKISVKEFLGTISPERQVEANELIKIMTEISDEKPIMWGPSIIGFGTKHYKYETGREGDMPQLGFSPRKAAITIYFSEGFNIYGAELTKLGKYKSSVSCLYINRLEDINLKILEDMIKKSFKINNTEIKKSQTVEDYINNVPAAAKSKFDELRKLVKKELPNAKEVLSYGIIGYKIDDKRARVFISGWKDHLAVYPIPKKVSLQKDLKPYIKGKGTLWFPLDQPLPKELIQKVVSRLTS